MKLSLSLLLMLLVRMVAAQSGMQVLRGTVTEEVSRLPIIGATVVIVLPDDRPSVGGVTNENGLFRIDRAPLGRQTLRISSLGYETITLPNVMVTAGKEVVLNLSMTQTVTLLSEVIVVSDRIKGRTVTNNELALVSGRAFNSEDTKRFAGSLGDPSRMAANFAGVVSGNDSRNDIVVRGNSPTGMLWQLEGLNIPNPNHFGALGTTGGPVSILNANTLAKSDFLTGAFPAQYGNALAGAFDLRLRTGNDEKRELVAQVGFNGFELGAEGMLAKGSKASYLVNYRYSTLGLFKALGINFGTTGTPNYQDLTMKIVVPTGLRGKITLFGLGGISNVTFLGDDVDTVKGDLYGRANANTRANYGMGTAGLSYEYTLSPKTFAKLLFGISATREQYSTDSLSTTTRQAFSTGEGRLFTQKCSAVFILNHRFSPKSSLYSGVTVDAQNANLFYQDIYKAGTQPVIRVAAHQPTVLTQAYSQWRYRFTNRLTVTAGLHFQHYSLARQLVLEPRTALKYQLNASQSVAVGYGLTSQIQNIYTTLVQSNTPAGIVYTNKSLGFTRSNQFALTYENRLTEQLSLKVEGYHQSIFDAPVEQRQSAFSALNTGASFSPSGQDSLVNKGTGTNFGLELTLERQFSRGYYFLLTGSLFNSTYRGSDGVLRNTAFNSHYVVNGLAGREAKLRSGRSALSFSVRVSTVGGRYFTPVNLEATRLASKVVYDDRYAYSVQQTPYFRIDLKVGYRHEYRNSTLELALDLQNLTNHKNIFQQTYNPSTNKLNNQYQQGFFPVPFVRYTF